MPHDGSGDVELIAVPCNLGLRPLRHGHEPGTWRAPRRLLDTGLAEASGARTSHWLDRPAYSADAQPGTRLYNGNALRDLNLRLADVVSKVRQRRAFPFVVGGDCSILLGALAGVRPEGPVALVHIDGHSDFRHPGNYDPASCLGAVAGMDLALATGRGEPLLTDWPGLDGPLVVDRLAFQVGEREGREPDFAWPDIADTAISRIDVYEANSIGGAAVVARIVGMLDERNVDRFWLHLDIDVLDEALMSAVDSPGTPGLSVDDLALIGAALVGDGRCAGLTLTVYDPDLDPSGECARLIIALARSIMKPRL